MKDSTVALRIAGIALWTTLALTSTGALAHEKAVLRSTLSAVAAGDTLPLSGADFTPGSTYALQLVGALSEFELRRVQGGAHGTLELAIAIPRDVTPGVYKLVAIAPDGDHVASLDLTILEPSAGANDDAHTGSEPGHAESGQTARADDMPIERSRSGAEWGVSGLLIGLAAGIGIMLIRRS